MKKATLFIVFISALAFLSSFKDNLDVDVKGWFLAGGDPKSYQIGVEKSAERKNSVAFLKSIKQSNSFGTIMQGFNPSKYLGKRVRMTGFIKSQGVEDWAGMWFRIDGEDKKMLGFDNMQNRPIKGNTSWTKYSIVVDAPENSKYFAYGVLLSGQGQVWLDDLSLEIVDKSEPLTAIADAPTFDNPKNLNFEDSGK